MAEDTKNEAKTDSEPIADISSQNKSTGKETSLSQKSFTIGDKTYVLFGTEEDFEAFVAFLKSLGLLPDVNSKDEEVKNFVQTGNPNETEKNTDDLVQDFLKKRADGVSYIKENDGSLNVIIGEIPEDKIMIVSFHDNDGNLLAKYNSDTKNIELAEGISEEHKDYFANKIKVNGEKVEISSNTLSKETVEEYKNKKETSKSNPFKEVKNADNTPSPTDLKSTNQNLANIKS